MIKNYIFRYGFYTVLFCMSIGLVYLTENLMIRDKIPVSVVTNSGQIKVFLPKNTYQPMVGDSIMIEQTIVGTLYLTVSYIEEEQYFTVITSNTDNEPLNGNSFTSGYIFTGCTLLKDLVIKKIKN